jgi:3-phosphoshikimate 1-carboxyvinyltransferase
VKSAVLLAGLFADGATIVREKIPTRRHTEELLAQHGIDVKTETDDGGSSVIELRPGTLKAGAFVVPGDPSQAAFWISAAAAVPGSDVTVENLYLAPERSGFLDVLIDMGADLDIDRARGMVRARGAELHGAVVVGSRMSDVIDEVPALAVAAAFAASGTLRFEDAAELRTKESDRIETVAATIAALGGAVDTGPDLLEIKAQALGAGSIASHHDHRMAMSAEIATSGMPEGSNVEIDDWSCVATSYPGFLAELTDLVA